MEGGGGARVGARGAARAGLRRGGEGEEEGEEGRAFLFLGLCPGSWGQDAEPSPHPSSLATQRLAEGRGADHDLPFP